MKSDSRGLRSILARVLVATPISVLRVFSAVSVRCFLLLFADMVCPLFTFWILGRIFKKPPSGLQKRYGRLFETHAECEPFSGK